MTTPPNTPGTPPEPGRDYRRLAEEWTDAAADQLTAEIDRADGGPWTPRMMDATLEVRHRIIAERNELSRRVRDLRRDLQAARSVIQTIGGILRCPPETDPVTAAHRLRTEVDRLRTSTRQRPSPRLMSAAELDQATAATLTGATKNTPAAEDPPSACRCGRYEQLSPNGDYLPESCPVHQPGACSGQ